MLIACPQCSAAYDLPPERLPPGREVRCARCVTLWTPVPLEPVVVEHPIVELPQALTEVSRDMAEEPRPAPVLSPGPPADVPIVAEAPPGRSGWLLPIAWCLTIAVLAGLAWLAVDRRTQLIQAWPPIERAYIALGLTPRP